MSNGAGKGDRPRPVNKKEYDRGWIRAFGKTCPVCLGRGIKIDHEGSPQGECSNCEGLGKVDPKSI